MAISREHKDPHSREGDLHWYLEGIASGGRTWIVRLEPFPFVIGRQLGSHLRLSSTQVSRHHAEIHLRDGTLFIREFGSINGTFVNRERVSGEKVLHDGDILYIGPMEFRVGCERMVSIRQRTGDEELTKIAATELPTRGFVDCEAEFGEMLRLAGVIPYFQPIVRTEDQKIIGYELLGRGDFKGVPNDPPSLLHIARRLGKEIELSELFRRIGVQRACQLAPDFLLFFNTVPAEMKLRYLQVSLQELRVQAPALPMALEVHEAAVTNLEAMKKIRALLDELDIRLVYDDFGAGQARLVELIQIPPDYLKFDITLIRNIHFQPPAAQKVLRTLVYITRELGIKTVAEGVELREEMEVCAELGFDHIQGYYFGRPVPYFAKLATLLGD
jgi:EAL domain-containing protein (putative c-di-GMP-specific phosphodiesterase class I)